MYIHFENWSTGYVQYLLTRKGLPNIGIVIKAFADEEDPRVIFDNPDLTVVEEKDQAFDDSEAFDYEGRESFRGTEIEERILSFGLSERGSRMARTLFRFSNGQGFCQNAMRARNAEDWRFQHPLEVIHQSGRHEAEMHLDIYFPPSLEILSRTVDLTNPSVMVPYIQGARYRRQLQASERR